MMIPAGEDLSIRDMSRNEGRGVARETFGTEGGEIAPFRCADACPTFPFILQRVITSGY